jgi:hypothetical protein
MTAEELSARFDISISAARHRLPEIERLLRIRDGVKRTLPKGVREFLQEAQLRGFSSNAIKD